MVGAGGGGSNFNSGNNGGIGGTTVFGSSLYAQGGMATVGSGNPYYGNTTLYPYLYYTGGIGGGITPIVYWVNMGSNQYMLYMNYSATISATWYYPPAVGSTVTLAGFIPTYWNGTYTIYTANTNSVGIIASSSTLTVPTTYGYAMLSEQSANTFTSAGQQGGSGYSNANTNAPPRGGMSMLGGGAGSLPTITINPLQNNPNIATTALPLGTPTFGAGGSGGQGTSSNQAGDGGGAGQYVESIINNPAVSYTYFIPSGGVGGGSDNGLRFACGSGGNGCIIVEAYF